MFESVSVPALLCDEDVNSSSSSEKYSELFCLSFNPSVNKEEREESWNFLDLMADYRRMGVPNNLWVSTAANSEFRVSVSRPPRPLQIPWV